MTALRRMSIASWLREINEHTRHGKRLLGKHMEQADSVIDYILGIRRGAFLPWLRHPIVQAILLPFSGSGVFAILEAIL